MKQHRTVNFKLQDLTRALIAANRAGTPVREVVISGTGMRISMDTGADRVGPPTQTELEAETAELDRLVAADIPAGKG